MFCLRYQRLCEFLSRGFFVNLNGFANQNVYQETRQQQHQRTGGRRPNILRLKVFSE